MMEKLLSLLLIGVHLWEMACVETTHQTSSERSLVLSITGFKNSSGHWVTKFMLNKMSNESLNTWKLDIHHNVTENDGVHELTLHGVFSENLADHPNDALEALAEPFQGEMLPNQAKDSEAKFSIVSREEWKAKEPRSKSRLPHPVELVIVRDEFVAPCYTPNECIHSVRKVQEVHLQNPYGLDIDANFLIAGDGRVYEGRGWDVVVDEVHRGLVVSFVGRYDVILPSQSQIDAFNLLIREGIKRGEISPYYKLFAYGQLDLPGYPGKRLFEFIKSWDHWTDETTQQVPFK